MGGACTSPWDAAEQLCFPCSITAALGSPRRTGACQSHAEDSRVPRTLRAQVLLVKIHLPCAVFACLCLCSLWLFAATWPLTLSVAFCLKCFLWPFAAAAAGCWCSDLVPDSFPLAKTLKTGCGISSHHLSTGFSQKMPVLRSIRKDCQPPETSGDRQDPEDLTLLWQ